MKKALTLVFALSMIAGAALELRPFNNGTYAVVVTPAATTGGTATRSLVAIGNDGSILWTLAL